MTASQKLGEKMYESQQAAAAPAQPVRTARRCRRGVVKPANDDNVVDAEVQEVKRVKPDAGRRSTRRVRR